MIPTIEWLDDKKCLRMVDQTRLPAELLFLEFKDYREVANSIKIMNVSNVRFFILNQLLQPLLGLRRPDKMSGFFQSLN